MPSVVAAALAVARQGMLTRDNVAAIAHCSPALVSHYFPTMPQLKRAVMREAIRIKDAKIVAFGLMNQDEQARKAPEELLVIARQMLLEGV